MRHVPLWLIAAVCACVVFVLPATSLAASPPAIEWTSAWNLTPDDATLGAGIDTNGLYTGYEFQIDTNAGYDFTQPDCPFSLPGYAQCESITVGQPLPAGLVEPSPEYLPAGLSGGQSVRLDLASIGATLQPGATYHYRVLASSGGSVVQGPDQTFTTPLATTPAVESESVSQVSDRGATLEAKVNSEDLPEGAYYQFQVVKSTSEYLSELACPEGGAAGVDVHDGCGIPGPGGGSPTPGALPIGYVEKGSEGQSVSLSLAKAGVTLQPGTTYHYRVLAVKRVQSEDTVDWGGPFVEGPDQTFTTPPAGSAPVIESVSISHLTPTDATLEAQIDTEGLPATYQFDLWSSPCSKHGDGCELILSIPLPSGLLLGSFVGQTVSLDLNSAGVTLGGGEYGYSVTATSTVGSTHGPWREFEAPSGAIDPPSPAASPQPGGGQAAASSGDAPTAGSGTTSSAASSGDTSNSLGVSKAGVPKRGAKRQHEAKHKHHRTKAPRRRGRGKKHKR
jgi:hypothetical protein